MHPPSSLDIFIKRRLISEKIRKNRCVIHNGLASASMNWRFLCLLAVIQWLSSTKPLPSENVVISVFLSPVSAVASVYQLEEINSKMVHLASWWTPHPSFSLRCFLFQFQPFLGELHLIALGVKGRHQWKKKTFSFGHCPNHLAPPPQRHKNPKLSG